EKKLSRSQQEGADAAKAKTDSAAATPSGPVAETFRVIQGAVTEEYVRSTQGVFQFELSGDGGGTWYIDLKTKGGNAGFGKPPVTADVVMSMSSADFVKMFTGEGQRPLSRDAGTGKARRAVPEKPLLTGE
ncbi:hydroxysteroid dehydrogenase-like protein 2, partial [Pyrgilauda ruficollis]|uniref:hydroxysteroid dehydrogenase-like protein 2 n=1 Tax=Pyrgilauda ruficollis TaxID=221976 RepID=UPI001B8762A2